MSNREPVTELDQQFSSEGATPTAWADARGGLEKAEIYWLSTVRPDGRPHTTPIAAVWIDDALYFCTGPAERKAKNLANNARCVITTGCNAFREGLDFVVEGDAVKLTDEAKLQKLADAFATKYDGFFGYTVRNGGFAGDGGEAPVFEVAPAKIFAYGRDLVFSATRYSF
jgi:nitroimidazol reductase NimA-like FMN-containing flavoprotein (pyridoxamine 5'-phosphate oxidase superfamily)